MYYKSTRNSSVKVSSAEAIAQGISPDGGLYLPDTIPEITKEDLEMLGKVGYRERAKFVFSKFLTDFTSEELDYCVDNAYDAKAFDSENIAELVRLSDSAYMLELWHGPTCAFKDMALQILPYLLTTSVKKLNCDKKVVILVATSGDTGKAALEGFKDVPGTSIMVFYPDNGVSAMQKKQMTTQEGENVSVCAIKGNFDDAQNGVKAIFTDSAIGEKLAENKMMFSSANSINWGRLAPQIIYYVSAYAQLAASGRINMGDKINIVVPTGNFGNILAAYYAKHMGVPINKLICASNINNVLTDFIKTGVYDKNRQFNATISPSMDILISSNLERLLYILTDGDDAAVRKWLSELSSAGRYEVTEEVKKKLSEEFWAGFASDDETKDVIGRISDKYSYVCDTHTAVAVKVYEDYKAETGDETPAVIASTASPYKFPDSVLSAMGESFEDGVLEFELIHRLNAVSGLAIPGSLAALENKDVRFTQVIDKSEMKEFVFSALGI